ncbi:MAG: geranylgeranylglyceryl/heptaprenylglyceryl phosphate synthase [Thaumarchaeota archaeon]|nr:geranylgeranylglyceryl/heptaprenylglyceryl phosphate synthase [Candidatus Calditenuaceae archaeon]MDW8186985.1 geranylgeranylglyceryl/heptaprenylglyceryl phosphate synthase [Nitrososphaerota archaeon]
MKLPKVGKVESYLHGVIEEKGVAHLTLLDPENVQAEVMRNLVESAESQGTDAFLVGGSTIYSREAYDEAIKTIKSSTDRPVIIFPNNVNAVSRYADAIFFMSLLNSLEWWFILGAQVHGAFLVKEYGLEAIPMGYIVFGSESSVAVVGRVYPIPIHKPNIAAAYALAAQYLGMRVVYLEAGSGVPEPLPSDLIRTVKRVVDLPVIVGGGIKSREQARDVARSGADMIVTGTLAEREVCSLGSVIEGIREGVSLRSRSQDLSGKQLR